MAFQLPRFGKLLEMRVPGGLDGSIIGIDVGASSLKVIQLTSGQFGPALETYGELQLGPYGGAEVGAPVMLDPSKLTAALADIIREASVTAKAAELTVPHAASFVIVVPFPTRDQNALSSMVPIEARKYVPMAMSEITLDWFAVPDVLPQDPATSQPTTTRVLMAAIHNESQKRYRGIVQSAGIAVVGNEIEPFSVVRSSIREDDTSVLLIDLGAASTKTYIVESGILEETHRMPLGGHDLTNAISTEGKLSYAEAESLKRSRGLEEQVVARAAEPLIERMQTELKRNIERFEAESGRHIEAVSLTGGGALLRGLPDRLGAHLERTVHVANPFTKVQHPAFLEETLTEVGASFSVALGVALRKFMN